MLAGPTIRRRRLGTDLRRLRELKSLKLEDVAIVLGVAPSTLSRIETGKAPTRTSYLTVMLDLYGVDDAAERRAFMELAREGQRRGWWADADDLLPAGAGAYLDLEAEAAVLRSFQAHVVHGLLQTPDYARAVIVASRPDLTAEQAERLVAVQLRRQEVLGGYEERRRGDSFQLQVVLDESVLLRAMGPEPLMRRQLEHLVAVSQLPTVNVRVARLSGHEQPILSGSFGILSFAAGGDGDVLCADGIRGQVLMTQRDGDVGAMRAIFERLGAVALTPEESAELIGERARTWPAT